MWRLDNGVLVQYGVIAEGTGFEPARGRTGSPTQSLVEHLNPLSHPSAIRLYRPSKAYTIT